MEIYNGISEVVCNVNIERSSQRKNYLDCQLVIRRAYLNFSFSNTVEYIVGKLYTETEKFVDTASYKVAFPYYEGRVIVCEFTGRNFDEDAYRNLLCAMAEALCTVIDEHLARFGNKKKEERVVLARWRDKVVDRYGIRKVCAVCESMPGYIAMKGSEVKVNA